MASQYDSKQWQIDVLEYVTKELRAHPDFFGIPKDQADGGSTFRLLDYACGTGNVSRALGPFVGSCLGVDVSPNMVSTYNSKAAAAGLDHATCHAHEGNLLVEEPYVVAEDGKRHQGFSNEHFNQFDACIVGLGFHHFENYATCLRTLSERVKSGGTIGIIDLLPKEGHLESLPEPMRHMMHVSGFSEQDMADHMKEAGLVDFAFMVLPQNVRMELKGTAQERTLFFARGRKP